MLRLLLLIAASHGLCTMQAVTLRLTLTEEPYRRPVPSAEEQDDDLTEMALDLEGDKEIAENMITGREHIFDLTKSNGLACQGIRMCAEKEGQGLCVAGKKMSFIYPSELVDTLKVAKEMSHILHCTPTSGGRFLIVPDVQSRMWSVLREPRTVEEAAAMCQSCTKELNLEADKLEGQAKQVSSTWHLLVKSGSWDGRRQQLLQRMLQLQRQIGAEGLSKAMQEGVNKIPKQQNCAELGEDLNPYRLKTTFPFEMCQTGHTWDTARLSTQQLAELHKVLSNFEGNPCRQRCPCNDKERYLERQSDLPPSAVVSTPENEHFFSTMKYSSEHNSVSFKEWLTARHIPTVSESEFDPRNSDDFKNCAVVKQSLNQQQTKLCWAYAMAGAMSTRICKHFGDTAFVVSPVHLVLMAKPELQAVPVGTMGGSFEHIYRALAFASFQRDADSPTTAGSSGILTESCAPSCQCTKIQRKERIELPVQSMQSELQIKPVKMADDTPDPIVEAMWGDNLKLEIFDKTNKKEAQTLHKMHPSIYLQKDDTYLVQVDAALQPSILEAIAKGNAVLNAPSLENIPIAKHGGKTLLLLTKNKEQSVQESTSWANKNLLGVRPGDVITLQTGTNTSMYGQLLVVNRYGEKEQDGVQFKVQVGKGLDGNFKVDADRTVLVRDGNNLDAEVENALRYVMNQSLHSVAKQIITEQWSSQCPSIFVHAGQMQDSAGEDKCALDGNKYFVAACDKANLDSCIKAVQPAEEKLLAEDNERKRVENAIKYEMKHKGPFIVYVNMHCLQQVDTGGAVNENGDTLDPKLCQPDAVNHAVQAVGWGNCPSNSGKECWLVQSSWGPGGGDGGYYFADKSHLPLNSNHLWMSFAVDKNGLNPSTLEKYHTHNKPQGTHIHVADAIPPPFALEESQNNSSVSDASSGNKTGEAVQVKLVHQLRDMVTGMYEEMNDARQVIADLQKENQKLRSQTASISNLEANFPSDSIRASMNADDGHLSINIPKQALQKMLSSAAPSVSTSAASLKAGGSLQSHEKAYLNKAKPVEQETEDDWPESMGGATKAEVSSTAAAP